jgi:hypothetical protein
MRRPIMAVSMNRRQSAQHRGPHLDKVDAPAIPAPAVDGSKKLRVGSSVSPLGMESDRVEGGYVARFMREVRTRVVVIVGSPGSIVSRNSVRFRFGVAVTLAETEPRISELETGVRGCELR